MKDFTAEDWEKVSFSMRILCSSTICPNFSVLFYVQYIFSDETMMELCPPRTQYVRRSVGESIRSCHTDSRTGFPIKVMLWGCMCHRGFYVTVISGNMNSDKYMATLATHLFPQAAQWYPCGDWVFQQDNARCHTSHATTEYLHFNNIDVLE
jgi:hypothetical protein